MMSLYEKCQLAGDKDIHELFMIISRLKRMSFVFNMNFHE